MSNAHGSKQPMTTIDMKCTACGGPCKVVVGNKSAVRRARCSCGAQYEYSCWRLGSVGGNEVHQVDAYPVASKQGGSR